MYDGVILPGPVTSAPLCPRGAYADSTTSKWLGHGCPVVQQPLHDHGDALALIDARISSLEALVAEHIAPPQVLEPTCAEVEQPEPFVGQPELFQIGRLVTALDNVFADGFQPLDVVQRVLQLFG